MEKFKYENLVPYIRAAQKGDQAALIYLLKKFDPLLKSKSRKSSKENNEDHYQELRLRLIQIILQFNLDRFFKDE